MIPVRVLSLPRSGERRTRIADRLASIGVPLEFCTGIDGRELSACELRAWAPADQRLFDRPLTAGEIGCAVGHLIIIKQIAEGTDEFVCVLEDDADPDSRILRLLNPRALRALPSFDVLRLVSDPARHRFPAWEVAPGVFAMARPGFGSQGQIWAREGARRVSAALPAVRSPIDFSLYHDGNVRGLRVLETRPSLLSHDRQFEDRSQIAHSVIGEREMVKASRWTKRHWRWRRKLMAMASFLAAWGFRGLCRILPLSRPGSHFR